MHDHRHSRGDGLLHRLHHALHAFIVAPFRGPRRGAPPYCVPEPPDTAPPPGVLRFFDAHQARTVDALTSRIFPAGPDGPGAHEAGAGNYIDYLLSRDDAFGQPIYRRSPFALAYRGDHPPPDREGTVWAPKSELPRHGFQSALDPREIYRRGLASLDRLARRRFGADFADLPPDVQDRIVAALADDTAEGFETPTAREFFQMVQEHTVEGTFSDPQYGGNFDMIGWRAIGFPGAQRTYAPEDLSTEDIDLEPQSLAQLHAFHPRGADQAHPHPAVAMPMPLKPRT